MNKLTQLLAYHNAVPILVGILFLSAGVAFAASPDVREAITATVAPTPPVDVSVLADADLSHFDPHIQITEVREDEAHYYVSYRYNTFTIEENAWQESQVEKTLMVSKTELGSADLKAYALAQLQEVGQYEVAYLKRAQSEAIASLQDAEEGSRETGLAGLIVGLKAALIPPEAKRPELVKDTEPEPVSAPEEREQEESSATVEPPAQDVVSDQEPPSEEVPEDTEGEGATDPDEETTPAPEESTQDSIEEPEAPNQ